MAWERAQAIELPPKYYLDNFQQVLGFVSDMYGHMLSEAEQSFIARFSALPEDARCLFIRFANRRGVFFRVSRLSYPEIEALPAMLQLLQEKGFAEPLQPAHWLYAHDMLNVFTKPELCRWYKPHLKEVAVSKLKKPELVSWLAEHVPWLSLWETIAKQEAVIKHCYEQELEMLKFLFFGHLGGEMSEFVVRDLGVVRYEQPDAERLVAKFACRKEAEDKYFISAAYQKFRELREEGSAESLYSWFMRWCARGAGLEGDARATFDRLCNKLGRLLERHKMPEWALEVYAYTQVAPVRERRVRLWQKLGQSQQAEALCQQILSNPQNAEEQFFATDFLSRIGKKRVRKSTTEHLKLAEVVDVEVTYRYEVEKGVMRTLEKEGKEVMYSENYLWRSLFGLVFWDIIFDFDAPVFHSPLQRFPSDLFLPNFIDQRRDALEERLDGLKTAGKLKKHIQQTYDAKWGLGNPLVGWHDNTLPLVLAACKKLKPNQIAAVLMEMARNLKENGRGFPDLFAWTKKEYAFIEVKSPNDTLSGQQLYWLQFFEQQGIQAQVLRVNWV